MRGGKLRHRITLQQMSKSRDYSGGYIDDWTDVSTHWASVEPLTGREYFTSDERLSDVNTRIILRSSETLLTFLDGEKTNIRVTFKNSFYDVKAVMNVEERNKQIIMMCKEIVN